ncbi:branched-chain amino acid ABC transporter permease [Oceanibaculum nanhaiense]|jgi:branched-chain amino acid transport system permease protein|uniref:branched-chain amino acid ABC transporter permease n=1 Tax=Oceanibaculum nanhaiense TaxID=1909734 RepID=UPI000A3CDC7F|nr:branched-chain amino acid ABC transporter permease [Oceanibaculum nanhaiense]
MTYLILNGLANGLILGVIYAMIGVSLSLLYGVLQVKNFAHGEFLIAGAYFCYVLYNAFDLHPLLALPLAFLCFMAFGWLLNNLVMPRLQRSDDPMLASLLVMYGVSLMLAATMLLLFEADFRSLDFSFEPISMKVGMLYLPTARLVAMGVTVAILLVLAWFLYFTLPGKAIRASIMNRDAVQIVGVNIKRLSAAAFALSIGLAGASGVMVSMVFPSFNPFVGVDYTLIGFIVVVLGGLGNPMGAILGGLVFGLAEQMSIVFLPQTMAPIIGFSIMILVIFFRPNGLLGKARTS